MLFYFFMSDMVRVSPWSAADGRVGSILGGDSAGVVDYDRSSNGIRTVGGNSGMDFIERSCYTVIYG